TTWRAEGSKTRPRTPEPCGATKSPIVAAPDTDGRPAPLTCHQPSGPGARSMASAASRMSTGELVRDCARDVHDDTGRDALGQEQ
ncbi:MAG: hypothetical protein ACRDRT_05055, partial [Pseudonocardiaceae bacterium]